MNQNEIRLRFEAAERSLWLMACWIGNYSFDDRVRLNVLLQCASKARENEDLEEATRIYEYVAFMCHCAMSDATVDRPDMTNLLCSSSAQLPISPGPWFSEEMFIKATRACTPVVHVPAGPAKLLYMTLPRGQCEPIVGDLEEEYVTVVRPRFGPAFARIWYWRQAIFTVFEVCILRPARGLLSRLKGVAIDVIRRWLTGG